MTVLNLRLYTGKWLRELYMYIINVHVYMYIYTYIHAYLRTYVRTYIRTYVHRYVCVCVFQSQAFPCFTVVQMLTRQVSRET